MSVERFGQYFFLSFLLFLLLLVFAFATPRTIHHKLHVAERDENLADVHWNFWINLLYIYQLKVTEGEAAVGNVTEPQHDHENYECQEQTYSHTTIDVIGSLLQKQYEGHEQGEEYYED